MKANKLPVAICVLLLVGILPLNITLANPIVTMPVIRILSDGSLDRSIIYSPTLPISINGSTYTLTADLHDYGFEVYRDGVTLDGNGCRIIGEKGYYYAGIAVYADHVTVKNFNVAGSAIKYGVIEGNGNTFSNVILDGNFDVSGDRNCITNSTLSRIRVNGTSNEVSNNFCHSLGSINVFGGNNLIERNVLDYARISLEQASFCEVKNNNISHAISGIELKNSSYNTIHGNSIANCRYAVFLTTAPSTGTEDNQAVKHNTFYHNNFLNNDNNMYIYSDGEMLALEADNFWDNGKEGNYWSNNTAADANGDGVTDEPYTIAGQARDNYPLTLPYDTQNNPLQTPNAPTTAYGSEVIIVVALLALIRGVIALAFYRIKNSSNLS